MKCNRILRILIVLIAAVMTAVFFTATALANEDGDDVTGDGFDIWDMINDLGDILVPVIPPGLLADPSQEGVLQPDPVTLTPPGNMDLIDDISGTQGNDKQFMTVVTKNGNYFYIVIDRAGASENVHFLNLVDEEDLLAILEDGKRPAATPATPSPVQPALEPEPIPVIELSLEPVLEAAEKVSLSSVIILVVLLGVLGGGVIYYFKVIKPKRAAGKGATTNLDEFVFDDDEDFSTGRVDYVSAGRAEEAEHPFFEPPDIDVPAESYADSYTYESYVPVDEAAIDEGEN